MLLPFLDSLRESIVTLVRESLPEPQASLLLGMVLGVKSGLPSGFYEVLRVTGTLHVVVVSGYNISVLINTLARVLIFIALQIRFLITAVFIFLFVLLVGPEAPVVRAAIMGSIALLGTLLGRQGDAFRAFIVAIGVMLLINPEWAAELSFQLSVLATLGLITIHPLLDRVVPGKGALFREDFLTTLAAQVAVWPLIAYSFGQVSLLSPVVNTLILWIVPFITYFGLVTITVGMFIKDLAFLIMTPIRLLLDYFIWIVQLFSRLSLGYFEIDPFSVTALIFYFVILGGGLWFLSQISAKNSKPSDFRTFTGNSGFCLVGVAPPVYCRFIWRKLHCCAVL
ncbi:hypothetical protein GTO10_01355 [Candidatus Saccharibacteria bacterium]|nr:hypothetical protein [Candidatus Saccharibacteria bacterium]